MHVRHHPAALLVISFLLLSVATWAQSVPARLSIAVAYAPKTLNPALATDAAAARLLQLTHPALLQWNATYQPVGLAATGCTQPTPAQAVCTLPASRHFTNGTPLTATLVGQWLAALQSNPRSPFSAVLKDISLTTPTSQTLVFTLPQPNIGFLATLTEIPLALPTNPSIGLGPYAIDEMDEIGNTTLSTRQPNLPQKLVFQFVADATTRLLKLKKGEVDLALNDLPPELHRWAQQQGFPTLSVSGTSYTYLGLNFQNENLANPTIREALTLALNRSAIRRHLLGGLAAPASTILPLGHPAAWPAPEEPTDPFSAEALLDEQDLLPDANGSRLTLTLLTSTDGFVQRVAQVLQAQWAKVGITVQLRPTEWGAFYDAVKKGQYDMVLLTWTGEQQPGFYYNAFHSSQVPPIGLNRGRVNDATTNQLTQSIHTATSTAAQTILTRQLQQHLATLRPYIPLYRRHHTLVMGQHVSGCHLTPSGSYHGLAYCRVK